MPFATTALIAGGLAAAGSLGGAALSSSAAHNAATTQAQAAEDASQLQYKAGQQALGFQQGQYNNTLSMEMPYYNAGLSGLTNLENLMGILPASASNTAIPNPRPLNVTGTPSGAQFPGTGNLPNTSQLMNGPQQYNPSNIPSPQGGPATAPRSNVMPAGSTLGPNGMPIPRAPGIPANGGTVSPQGVTPGGIPSAPGATPGAAPSGTSGAPIPNSLSSLINPQLGASGSLMTPFLTPFQAPTSATEANDPGYQFRLNQGTQALDNSAAAKGDLLSGNTLQGVTQFGQDYASNEYGNVYNRALQQYQLAQNNSTNIFNRLADVSGLGQTSLQQLANSGTSAAGQIGNTLTNTASLMGQDTQNAAAATASGYVGSANAYGGALGNIGSIAGMLPFLSQLMQRNPTDSQLTNLSGIASDTAGTF